MAERLVNVTIDPDQSGRTVAAVLKRMANVSNSVARGIVAAGRVTRNGAPIADPTERVAADDVIVARFDPGMRYAAPSPPRKEVGFRTVLEDAAFLVLDKPAGLLTVPVPDSDADTLIARVEESLRGRGFRRPGIRVVHRIDQMTSGLVLMARTPEARADLIEQFSRREPLRQYAAVCQGIVEPAKGTWTSWLVEDPVSHRVHPTADRKVGQEATLHYRTVERFRDATLVEVRLETGRKNQIRVQFAERGFPLVGDRKYGHPSPLMTRVALHAARLGFSHPSTGKRVDVEAPPPVDFTRLLDRLRAGVTVARRGAERSRPSAPAPRRD